ncbi:hypothetical protein EDC94DRAFT_651524, partial [Helicostylum pulchrum]
MLDLNFRSNYKLKNGSRPFVTVVPIDRWRTRKQVSAVYILLKSCQGITSYDWRCSCYGDGNLFEHRISSKREFLIPAAVNLVELGRPFVTVVPIDRWRTRKQVSAVYILLKSCQGITSYDWR